MTAGDTKGVKAAYTLVSSVDKTLAVSYLSLWLTALLFIHVPGMAVGYQVLILRVASMHLNAIRRWGNNVMTTVGRSI